MKSILAKALTLAMLLVGMVAVVSPAHAAITSETSCTVHCSTVSYDNSNPSTGDTVAFTVSYPECSPEISCQIVDGTSFVAQNTAAQSLTVSEFSASQHIVNVTFSQPGTYRFSFTLVGYVGYFFDSQSAIFTVTVANRVVPVGTPTNVMAYPHDSSAFISWVASARATSYTVTASPSGQTCTTSSIACSIYGLTNGTQQTFTVTASNGTPAENATSTATTAVTIAEPLQITGSVQGTTWKVGTTVTVYPYVVGNPTRTEFQWYRCDSAVPASPAQSSCSAIAGQTSMAYALAAADLGKYVTVVIRAVGAFGDAVQTIENSRVTVAVDAVIAPQAPDLSGKPSITSIPVREIPFLGGTNLVITGTNLADVNSVSINGVAATVISSTATSLTVKVPPSANKAGLVDLVVSNDKGSATSALALNYVQSTPTIYKAKVLAISGFASATVALSASFKSKIKAFVLANKGYGKLACVGDVRGLKKSSTQLAASLARAKSACIYAKTIDKTLVATSLGRQSKLTGTVSRLVTLTLNR